MNLTRLSLFFILLTAPFLHAQDVPSSLRGGIPADQATISQALEMQKAGWVYTMPEPKSKKAAWGVRDGRTTWWVGHWDNTLTKQTSAATPTRGGWKVGWRWTRKRRLAKRGEPWGTIEVGMVVVEDWRHKAGLRWRHSERTALLFLVGFDLSA